MAGPVSGAVLAGAETCRKSLPVLCHRLASDIEIMMRERFSVLNHIIWAKPSGRWNGATRKA